MLYLHPEKNIIARAHNNCHGCQQDSPGQRDHMEFGCLCEWEDLVYQYYPESVAAFSRRLFVNQFFNCRFRKM